MGTKTILTSMSLLAMGACLAGAQTEPLLSQTFKDNDGGWVAFGGTAKASVSHEAEITQPAAGALKFEYAISKGDLNGLYLTTPLGSWTKARNFKFRVHADSATTIVLALQEQDGGRYVSMVNVPKGLWQTIELSTSDFILATDKDDPKDPDGKLDMDKVTGVGVVDMSQFFASVDNSVLAGLFDVKLGSHQLYIDSFTVGSDSIPAGSTSLGDDVQIETFNHPQLAWIGLGGVKLVRAEEKPLTGPCLRADYHQTPGKPTILSRAVPSWVLTGSKSISFDIATLKPAKIVVQLEQTDGGKYNAILDLPGGSLPTKAKLALTEFKRSDDSKDDATVPHVALIKNILIMDASGMFESANADNTLWVNHLVASAKP